MSHTTNNLNLWKKTWVILLAFVFFVITFKIIQIVVSLIATSLLNWFGVSGDENVRLSISFGEASILFWLIFVIQKTRKILSSKEEKAVEKNTDNKEASSKSFFKNRSFQKIIISIVSIVIFFNILNSFFLHEYKEGDCLESQDSYIWHINSYSLGKYSVMGWQTLKSAWGNEVTLTKDIIEGEDYENKIPRYHLVECPVFGLPLKK